MTFRLLAAFLLLPSLQAEPASAPFPAPFALMQAWAGPDAPALGFTQEQAQAFLQARSADIRAGRSAPWSDWLKKLEGARTPALRAWALARRVEAGDYSAYLAFQAALTEHLLGISRPGSGRSDRVIFDPPTDRGLPDMPGALRIDHASPFWTAFRNSVLAAPDRRIDGAIYAVWCYGTHPDQKDLILDLARHVEASVTVRNRTPDPWNDPRFWIVLDWTLVWSTRQDRAELQAALAKGPVRNTFDRVVQAAEKVPAFFPEQPEPSSMIPSLSSLVAKRPPATEYDFSQIRVKKQPVPPSYPSEPRQRKMMTTLIVDLVVDAEGTPVSCRPQPGPWLGFFAPVGTAYGLDWRFHPAVMNGVPVSSRFRLTLPFRLRN